MKHLNEPSSEFWKAIDIITNDLGIEMPSSPDRQQNEPTTTFRKRHMKWQLRNQVLVKFAAILAETL